MENNNSKSSTRYEKRAGRKTEEEKRLKRESRFRAVVLIIVAAVCIGVLGGKQVNKYLDKYGTYISIGDHKIKKSEFDFYYYASYSNFMNTYGSYASYFGLDTSSPLDQQYYTDDLTWKDYFEQQAVDSMTEVYALYDKAKEEGYEYDPTDEVNDTISDIKDSAKENDEDLDDYIKSLYGDYATLDKVKEYLTMSEYANSYYDKVDEETTVSEEEVTDYYNEHKDTYDSFDYMLCEIDADIPEDEEEEEVVETDASESEESETMSESESEALEAEKEAEKEKQTEQAMADAKAKADEMEAQVTDQQSFEDIYDNYVTDASVDAAHTGETGSSIDTSLVEDWLVDESRQEGDKTVIEDTDSNCYYVVLFLKRYRDESKTVDFRHILIEPEEVDTDSIEAQVESEFETAEETTAETAETEAAAETTAEAAETEAAAETSVETAAQTEAAQITADTVAEETVKSSADSETEAAEITSVETETETETMSAEESEAESEAVAEAEVKADDDAKAKAEKIYKKWKKGKATEKTFAKYANKYSEDTGSNTDGGLYEKTEEGSMVTEINDWLFDDARQPGDTAIVKSSYGYHIMYFVGDNSPAWYNNIESTIKSDKLSDFMDEIEEGYEVKDPRHKLNYLTVKEEESETAETSVDTEAETSVQ